MSEQPLTRAVLASVLADFHRDVILPDVERVVRTSVGELRLEMNAHFDDVYRRFERLETEYQLIKAGLAGVEERLDRVEERLDRIETRLDGMEGRLDGFEGRLERVERRVDDAIDRVDELGLRFEGTENRLGQLAEQILELRTRIGRVEERLEELIGLEEKYPVRAEVQDLKARVELLQESIRRLEQRLKS